MEIPEILEELRSFEEGKFPREALEAAVAQRDRITPALLEVVQDVADDPRSLEDDNNYAAYMQAVYLLAQFREKRAYEPIVRFCSESDEETLDLTGDFVTEDLDRVLASVSCGDDSLIRQLVENTYANEYVRSAGLHSLVSLVACGDKSREDVIDYFAGLFRGKFSREPHYIWDSLVSCSIDLYPEDLCLDIEQVYRDDLVDEFFVSRKEVRDALAVPKEEALARLKKNSAYRLITDAVEEIESWNFFSPKSAPPEESEPAPATAIESVEDTQWMDYYSTKPIPTYVRTTPKIGRNEPCPCGSGKKYKKCCGRP
ncbi:MAG: DUF1186 domain-containing protein [Desulfomonile sp.]|nr:DUF1186 domain-containing protein [Desulfomonile sp.]